MSKNSIQAVKSRKNFYQNAYRKMLNLLVIAMLVILCLSAIIIYIQLSRSLPSYYATSNDGKLIPLSAINKPNESNTPLIQ